MSCFLYPKGLRLHIAAFDETFLCPRISPARGGRLPGNDRLGFSSFFVVSFLLPSYLLHLISFLSSSSFLPSSTILQPHGQNHPTTTHTAIDTEKEGLGVTPRGVVEGTRPHRGLFHQGLSLDDPRLLLVLGLKAALFRNLSSLNRSLKFVGKVNINDVQVVNCTVEAPPEVALDAILQKLANLLATLEEAGGVMIGDLVKM